MQSITITFKTPDAVVGYATEDLSEEDRETAEKVISKFVQFGESLEVEFDIDNKIATVLKA